AAELEFIEGVAGEIPNSLAAASWVGLIGDHLLKLRPAVTAFDLQPDAVFHLVAKRAVHNKPGVPVEFRLLTGSGQGRPLVFREIGAKTDADVRAGVDGSHFVGCAGGRGQRETRCGREKKISDGGELHGRTSFRCCDVERSCWEK